MLRYLAAEGYGRQPPVTIKQYSPGKRQNPSFALALGWARLALGRLGLVAGRGQKIIGIPEGIVCRSAY
jgi:hypothetical protein